MNQKEAHLQEMELRQERQWEIVRRILREAADIANDIQARAK
jgi:hypothetical protein